MTTAVAKAVKGATSAVKSHLEAFDRAREIYLAQIKRAEADYFDRIRRATAMLAGEPVAEASDTPPDVQTTAEAPPA